ncbi:hypothetical protein Hanom_Chr13g01209481 [Helianthus anomalus]
MDTLVSNSEWMRNRGVAACAVRHRVRYIECALHVEEALGQQFGTRHCSVTDRADEMLSQAEEVYDHLSSPVMELVIEPLKHDDYVARLKSILVPPEIVELSDEEEEEVSDNGDGGNEYVVGCLDFCLVIFPIFKLVIVAQSRFL